MFTKTQLKKRIDDLAMNMRSYLSDDNLPTQYMLGAYDTYVEVYGDYDPLRKEGVLTKKVENKIIYGSD